MLDSFLVIGEILKPQGVRGEMKLRPITCDTARFYDMNCAYLEKDGTFSKVGIRVTRVEADAVYLMMDAVRDRDDAEKMRGQLLYIDRAHAVKLPKDAEFVCDLIGCEATDDAGDPIGTLTDVLQPGAGDVYVFKGPRGEVLVPALKSVVLKVDVAEKKILLSRAKLNEVAVFDDD